MVLLTVLCIFNVNMNILIPPWGEAAINNDFNCFVYVDMKIVKKLVCKTVAIHQLSMEATHAGRQSSWPVKSPLSAAATFLNAP